MFSFLHLTTLKYAHNNISDIISKHILKHCVDFSKVWGQYLLLFKWDIHVLCICIRDIAKWIWRVVNVSSLQFVLNHWQTKIFISRWSDWVFRYRPFKKKKETKTASFNKTSSFLIWCLFTHVSQVKELIIEDDHCMHAFFPLQQHRRF